MLSTFRRMLTPPKFSDEIKNQQAYLLHVIVWVLVGVPIPLVVYTLLETPEHIGRVLTQAVFGEILNVMILVMLRTGYVRSASLLQVSGFWLFFTATAVTGMGVQGEAYLMGYGLVIAIAGILLGGRGALLYTLLSLLAGGIMVYAQGRGWLVPHNQSLPFTTWVLSIALFSVGATLQYLNTRTVRRALARARESEERYRLISDVSTDYTFASEVDQAGNAKTAWVAGALQKMTGYTFDEYMKSGGWIAHVHPEDLAKDAHDMELLRKNQDIRSEIRTFTKSGEIRWERVYAHPVWDAQADRLVRIVGAVQDVTQEKKAEVEREALITELEKKNAELERFAYTVSHDLKSPLVTITGYLGYLEQDAFSGNMQGVQASVGRITTAARKMQRLLSDLLELSRIGVVLNSAENIPFETIVREALDHVRGQLDASGAAVDVQRDLPVVRGDRVRLVEVVQNLLDNAVKFAAQGSAPRIEIGCRGFEDGKNAIFYVRDRGIGVAPQFHERIFGLFNKLDVESDGTGVGLALVKRIIEAHAGRIWVESQVGQGAEFCFTLPLAEP